MDGLFRSRPRPPRVARFRQGCKTALVTETTPLARILPVAGRKSVSSLAVPPRSYSCGCKAGWPSGCELRPRLRDGLIRPSFVFVQLHDPRGFRLLARQLDQSFFSGVSGS